MAKVTVRTGEQDIALMKRSFVAFLLVLRGQAKTRDGQLSTSLLKLRLPIFGKFVLMAELARFCRTLELLLKNGIPILRALNIAIPVLSNVIIQNKLNKITTFSCLNT